MIFYTIVYLSEHKVELFTRKLSLIIKNIGIFFLIYVKNTYTVALYSICTGKQYEQFNNRFNNS